MEELFLPVLSHFQNGNFWSASVGRMSYRVVPDGEKLAAEVWEGPWCYQLSRVEERREFPMDESGLADLAAWAGRWGAEINARPARTLADTLATRDAVRAEQAERADGD